MSLNENDYKAIARNLLESIGDDNFFNGNIEYQTESRVSNLRATLIIDREKKIDGKHENCGGPITGIIPVWWEFHAYQQDKEIENDFSWREFREYMFC